MKQRLINLLLSIVIIAFVFQFVVIILLTFTDQNEDEHQLDVVVKTIGLSGFQPFRSEYRYVKTPGKYDDIEFDFQLRSKDKGTLSIISSDIVTEGLSYDMEPFEAHIRFKNVKITDPKEFRIFIPKGTVITGDDYILQDDFQILYAKLIPPKGMIPLDGLKNLLEVFVWAFLASVAVNLLGILGSFFWKFKRKSGV